MLNLLMTTLARSREIDTREVHFHVDEAGRRFACYLRDCRPARRLSRRPSH